MQITGITPYYEDKAGVIICGHTPEVLKTLPDEFVDCVITSPPYWGLRDYGIEPQVWGATPAVGDGNGDCEHKWESLKIIKSGSNWDSFAKYRTDGGAGKREIGMKNISQGNFCSLCGAWRGSLGLEPSPELYIKHLCDIFNEVKRVLKKTGSIWVNLGDSYGGNNSRGSNGGRAGFGTEREGVFNNSSQAKSLVGIPEMFVLEMQRRGWIRRNTIIWYKPNCMPSSAQDRFTVDFEYIYLFTKSNDAQFWTNEKTLQLVSKPPAGTQGIEGQDWEWRVCPNCEGTGKSKVNIEKRPEIYGEEDWGNRGRVREFLDKKSKMYQAGNLLCKRCKGTGQIKHNFWSGHDYFFERQFEKLSPLTNGFGLVERGKQNYFIDRDGHNKQKESFTKSWYGEPPQGRNKRCVWRIPTQSFSDAHFATFPEKLVQDCLLPGCPEFVCPKCGKPRVKIYDINYQKSAKSWGGITYNQKEGVTGFRPKKILDKISTEIGYTDCGCGEKFEGGVCLDPFMGSGTVGVVALKLRRKFIGIEIKPEYCKMAEARIKPLMAQERLL